MEKEAAASVEVGDPDGSTGGGVGGVVDSATEVAHLRATIASLQQERENTAKLVAMLQFNNEHNKNKVCTWLAIFQRRLINLRVFSSFGSCFCSKLTAYVFIRFV